MSVFIRRIVETIPDLYSKIVGAVIVPADARPHTIIMGAIAHEEIPDLDFVMVCGLSDRFRLYIRRGDVAHISRRDINKIAKRAKNEGYHLLSWEKNYPWSAQLFFTGSEIRLILEKSGFQRFLGWLGRLLAS